MRNVWGVLPVLLLTGLGTMAVSGGAPVPARAAEGKANGQKLNACGCYRDAAGSCFCGKKSKCLCPGECEPKACEEKRAKDMDKEVEAESKRAREAEKNQRDADAVRRKKAEAVNNDEETAAAARLEAAEAEAKDEGSATSKKAKSSKRGNKSNPSENSESENDPAKK